MPVDADPTGGTTMPATPAALLLGLLALAAPPDDLDDVKALLAKPALGPGLALAEVQAFAESRLPAVPRASTAEEWRALADRWRADTLALIFRGEAAAWRDAPCRAEWQGTIDGGPGYLVKKFRFEAVPGLWVPALLYEPAAISGKVPVVLNVQGHDPLGKAGPDQQRRCIALAKKGILAMSVEWLGMGQLNAPGFGHGLINGIDLTGTSGVAVHYLSLKNSLDILLDHPNADPRRVAVTGLSGGGWQTIFFSALDTRVTLTDPVAGYSSFRTRARFLDDLGDSEQTPSDLATVVDYTHLTAMMAPRPTLLTFNAKDQCCFRADHALPPLLDAAGPAFALFHAEDNLKTHINEDPGDHNYKLDNRRAFYRFLATHWKIDGSRYDDSEAVDDAEIRSPAALSVPLPEGNLDFRSLALKLAAGPSGEAVFPVDERLSTDTEWQRTRRRQLWRVVRPYADRASNEDLEKETRGKYRGGPAKIRIGQTWTVPGTWIDVAGADRRSVLAIVVADAGRAGAAAEVLRQLDAGRAVLAVDPFHLGESNVGPRGWLYAILTAALGERPLGLQAGQILSIARAFRQNYDVPGFGPGRVIVSAVGPRSSLAALVAAAMGEEDIQEVHLRGGLASLREPIEAATTAERAPELFAFGLYREFDVLQLAGLVAPRPVSVYNPTERAERELGGLSAWYRRLGAEWSPLRVDPLERAR